MANKQAVWIHGSALIPERQGYFIAQAHRGYGSTLATHGKEWVHFAIPTPVLVDGVRSRVEKVFVLYQTQGSSLVEIHLFDGAERFDNGALDFSAKPMAGDHGEKLDSANSWSVAAHSMKFGLGISVLVDFGPGKAGQSAPRITFRSAGADFVTP